MGVQLEWGYFFYSETVCEILINMDHLKGEKYGENDD